MIEKNRKESKQKVVLIADLQKEKSKQEIIIQKSIETENDLREEELEYLQNRYQEERNQIIKKYKGDFKYKWSHRRRSWDFANGELYINIKNDIYKIIDGSNLKKLSKIEFIQKIINWKNHDA